MAITRFFILLFSLVCILFFGGFRYSLQIDAPMVLRDSKLNFTPSEFYISDVEDERDDRRSVAVLLEKQGTQPTVARPVDLKGGAAIALKSFIYRNLYRDTSLRTVIVTIKEFKLTESILPNGRVSGHLAVVFSFALLFSDRTVHLVDYSGGLRYNRPDNQPVDAETILRQGIEQALSYFNKWINNQAESNALLAKSVKVRFTDYSESPEGDTIYYSVSRPLTWADFKDKPRVSRFEAEVFTSIGYTEQNEVIKGIIYVNMAIKVNVAKSDCFVKEGSHDGYILNHEQRHFDIEKLVSEHFKQKIFAMDLPVDNFYGFINVEYLETLREATRMQKLYDNETRHGQDRSEQERWNKKIDKELESYGFKK